MMQDKLSAKRVYPDGYYYPKDSPQPVYEFRPRDDSDHNGGGIIIDPDAKFTYELPSWAKKTAPVVIRPTVVIRPAKEYWKE